MSNIYNVSCVLPDSKRDFHLSYFDNYLMDNAISTVLSRQQHLRNPLVALPILH